MPALPRMPHTRPWNHAGAQPSEIVNCWPDMRIQLHHFGVLNHWLLMHMFRIASTTQILIQICWMHQHNVKWFGSQNWTTQQLWTATLIIPDAPRCSKIGWMQSEVFPGVPWLLHQYSSLLRKLWNRIQEYSNQCIVDFKMLPNQTIRMCKFQSYWEYWLRLQEYSGAPRTWSHTLWQWSL